MYRRSAITTKLTPFEDQKRYIVRLSTEERGQLEDVVNRGR
jgi:hypothetical protein